MADIISIEEKRADARKQEAALRLQRKRAALRTLRRCACCSSECEKCGEAIPPGCARHGNDEHRLRVPYRFCENCSEDYIAYIERLKGRTDPECYWRNEAWLEVWTAWIHYRAAMDRHFKSKEFLQLVRELRPSPSDP